MFSPRIGCFTPSVFWSSQSQPVAFLSILLADATKLTYSYFGSHALCWLILKLQSNQALALLLSKVVKSFHRIVAVQSLSPVFVNPWTAAHLAALSFTISWSLLKLMSIKSMMPSNHLILCHPFSSCPVLPSIRVFSSESALQIRWPKYWSFSFSISPSQEYPRLFPFRINWFDLLAV